MVATGDPNKVVRVILQADDLNNADLRNVLAAGGVQIQSTAGAIGMMVIDLPVRLAEAVANARGSRHLSMDRELKVLGHIETTTGAGAVRGLLTALLGGDINGKGIGIAIVDSSIREDHRSFVDDNGSRRVVQRVSFINDNNLTQDEYGHGTHVASLRGWK